MHQHAINNAPGKPNVRRVFLLMNPFGGRKKALEIVNTIVKPLFTAAAIEFECTGFAKAPLPNLFTTRSHTTTKGTTHAGHAAEVAASIDMSKYDAFVTCSGDGLLWESIQGFMQRSDWKCVF
jgi:sphingosine kinase